MYTAEYNNNYYICGMNDYMAYNYHDIYYDKNLNSIVNDYVYNHEDSEPCMHYLTSILSSLCTVYIIY